MCTVVLVGGIDMMSQAIMLAKKPHVIVGEGQANGSKNIEWYMKM